MNDLPNAPKDQNDPADVRRHPLALPLAALGLVLLPVFLGLLGLAGISAPAYSLLVILSPIAGLITGVSALSQGKEHIGLAGRIIAITAIALPLAVVAFIIIFFIGAATGLISLM